ncbi:MAG: Uma2 family endonuclease [Verrucomicrobiota bacterium]
MPSVAHPEQIDLEDRSYTFEEFMRLGLEGKAELVEGKIKYPAMSWTTIIHASLVGWLSRVLGNWADETKWGIVLNGDAGIRTKENSTRGADVIAISFERYQQVGLKGKVVDVGPELIIEVVPPSNTWNDINQKLKEYFERKTDEVWIASPEQQTVTVYNSLKSSQSFSAEDEETVTSKHLPGFELHLTELRNVIEKVS